MLHFGLYCKNIPPIRRNGFNKQQLVTKKIRGSSIRKLKPIGILLKTWVYRSCRKESTYMPVTRSYTWLKRLI